jgi:hypothetical protein
MFDADFYVKADDAIYLRPDRLAALLAKDRLHQRTYIGCMKKGPVVNDPNMKWLVQNFDTYIGFKFIYIFPRFPNISISRIQILYTI